MNDEEGFTVKEGKANIYFDAQNKVFYNPVQEYNRDLSICVIRRFFTSYGLQLSVNKGKLRRCSDEILKLPERKNGEFLVVEGLAASGLRSIRYATEIPEVKFVLSNDIDLNAVESIRKNSVLNGVDTKIVTSHMDASYLFATIKSTVKQPPEVIDIDPYGTSAPFLDSAVQAIDNGGLLCVTCTDLAILCGNSVEAGYMNYGSVSLKSKFCHEMALRILLNKIESTANLHKKYIQPLVCASIDFYVRVFVRVFYGPEKCKYGVLKKSFVYFCDQCHSFDLDAVFKKSEKFFSANKPRKCVTCDCCNGPLKIGGPIWSDKLQDNLFITDCLEFLKTEGLFGTQKRMIGMLTLLKDEEPDSCFYYPLTNMFSFIKCTTAPILQIMSDLIRQGYRVTQTHAKTNCIKTNASSKVVWNSIKAWVQMNKIKLDKVKNPRAIELLNVLVEGEHDFTVLPELVRKTKILRYQVNPTPNWGPISRGKVGKIGTLNAPQKRKKK